MTGGAFRNNSNLLGRNREIIEELEELISKSEQKIKESRNRLEDIKTHRVCSWMISKPIRQNYRSD